MSLRKPGYDEILESVCIHTHEGMILGKLLWKIFFTEITIYFYHKTNVFYNKTNSKMQINI